MAKSLYEPIIMRLIRFCEIGRDQICCSLVSVHGFPMGESSVYCLMGDELDFGSPMAAICLSQGQQLAKSCGIGQIEAIHIVHKASRFVIMPILDIALLFVQIANASFLEYVENNSKQLISDLLPLIEPLRSVPFAMGYGSAEF